MLKRAIRNGNFPSQLSVIDFKVPELGLKSLMARCDKDLGGFSTVDLSVVEAKPRDAPARAVEQPSLSAIAKASAPISGDPEKFGVFQGDLSLDLPEDNPEVVKLGYAMFRTQNRKPSFLGLFGDEYMNWSPYTQVALRVRGDYRKYFVNIQAETPYKTDLYQHRLFLKNVGEWEVVTIPFVNFILTNGGIIQRQAPLDTEHIRSIGIGLIDGQYGPYRLDVDWVKVIAGEFDQGIPTPQKFARPDIIGGDPAEIMNDQIKFDSEKDSDQGKPMPL